MECFEILKLRTVPQMLMKYSGFHIITLNRMLSVMWYTKVLNINLSSSYTTGKGFVLWYADVM
jgi:hypothetical protein